MNELQAFVRLINKLTDWEEKACNFFYVTEGHKDISPENLKTTFNNFISENFSNAKFENIEDLKNQFKNLNYDQKISYFKPDHIYVIDCTNIDKDSIHTFNAIYDLTKEQKIAFINYVSVDKHRDYLIQTQTYQFRASGLENIDDSLSKIYAYNEFKNEINATPENNTSSKKAKI